LLEVCWTFAGSCKHHINENDDAGSLHSLKLEPRRFDSKETRSIQITHGTEHAKCVLSRRPAISQYWRDMRASVRPAVTERHKLSK